MDDQVPVSMLHDLGHRAQQSQASRQVQTVLLAEPIQGQPLDILHDEIGTAVGRDAAIQ